MRDEDPYGLLARLRAVRRARGFRLYLADGRRIVDLWQCGGAAILGHTPHRVLGALKNTAARGLFASFPGPLSRRLERLLSTLVPGFPAVRVFADRSDAESALREAGFAAARLSDFHDPGLRDPQPEDAFAWWRPWAPMTPGARILAPILPVPLPLAARPIAFLMRPETAQSFPLSSQASPLFLSLAVRAVADLIAALPFRTALPPLIEKARKVPGAPVFRGPYFALPAASDPPAYSAAFDRFLHRGFLLPPDPRLPAILPYEASDGETAALASLLSEFSVKVG